MDRYLQIVDPKYPQFSCYKHLHEIMCYILSPRCHPQTKQMVPPCREACSDLVQGCFVRVNLFMPQINFTDMKMPPFDLVANCSYLPPANGSLPCFYKPVTCPAPPNVQNGFRVNYSDTNTSYPLDSVQEYVCQDEYKIRGDSTVTCLYSGQWTEVPVCVNKRTSSMSPISVVLPILILPLVLSIAILLRFTCSGQQVIQYQNIAEQRHLRRAKEFDAYVCYASDNDCDFAEYTIREALDPPFHLCTHRRHFKPSYTIVWNILNAVKNSNSAIIVMSQDFVDSDWCRLEFEVCFMENKKTDPAFRLFVIMMQPEKTLENISEYMEIFFKHNSYLEVEDPDKFHKIAEYLSSVKKPEADD